MQISIMKAKAVRVQRMSTLANCFTLVIEGEDDRMEITLYGMTEDDRIRLCSVLGDAESVVRTQSENVPMAEWLIENAVHKKMGVQDDA